MAEMAGCQVVFGDLPGTERSRSRAMGDSAMDGKDSSCYALILPGMGVLQVADRRVQYR